MRIFILGGGPAGLAVAHGLSKYSDLNFTLVERENLLGGLAKTLNWNGDHHDLGPHKIFTLNPELMALVRSLRPESEWIEREKISSIYMNGHYLNYPPSPFGLIPVYGLFVFAKMVLDYGLARLRALVIKRHAKTFAEDLEIRVGVKLYNALFRPIAEKLWGDPRELDVKLSQGRVQTPKLTEVLARLLKLRKTSDFEALTFSYPRGGLQKLWDAIEGQSGTNGDFLKGYEVTRIEVAGKRVNRIELKELNTLVIKQIDILPGDFVVSSLPMSLTAKLLGDSIPKEMSKNIEELYQMNDLILVFLKYKQADILKESWIFIPDPEVAFHRLSEQESFDPEMTPSGSVVCCEVMSHAGRPMMKKSDAELIAEVKSGLEKMGKDSSFFEARVIRLPKSYPVFKPGYQSKLQRALDYFDSFENMRTVGRQGAFNYIGTLDAMDIGYGTANWLKSKSMPEAKKLWSDERARTEHFAVLD